MENQERPLQIGETVRYNAYATAVSVVGVVVERLGNDCLRVQWQDIAVPTTHRSHSLRRATDRHQRSPARLTSPNGATAALIGTVKVS
jgi:hypothetical protein